MFFIMYGLVDLIRSTRQITLPWSFLVYVVLELIIEYEFYLMLASVAK